MKGTTVILLLALALLSLAQSNYQERAIYLSETDNPCRAISHKEKVNLEIHVSGKPSIMTVVDSTTVCDPEIVVPEKAIWPSNFIDFGDSNQGHHVYLNEESR